MQSHCISSSVQIWNGYKYRSLQLAQDAILEKIDNEWKKNLQQTNAPTWVWLWVKKSSGISSPAPCIEMKLCTKDVANATTLQSNARILTTEIKGAAAIFFSFKTLLLVISGLAAMDLTTFLWWIQSFIKYSRVQRAAKMLVMAEPPKIPWQDIQTARPLRRR